MNANLKTALVVVGALGLLAGGLWWLRQQPRPVPQRAGVVAKGSPGQETVPVAPAVGATATALAEPGTVTVVGGPPGDYVVRDAAGGQQALAYAVELLGAQSAVAAAQRSTWRMVISGDMQRAVTVQADLARGVLIRDDESGDEVGWIDGACWSSRGEVVVPCTPITAGLARSVFWMLRGQIVAPLVASPWVVAKATAYNNEGQLTNTMALEPRGPVAAAPGMVLVHTDARTRRVARVDITNTSNEAEKAQIALPRAQLDFDDPRPFGALTLSASVRMVVGDYDKPDELQFRVVSMRPGAELPAQPRQPQWPKTLQMGTRPAGLGLVFDVGARAKIPDQLVEVSTKLLRPMRLLQFDLVEAQAPAGAAADTGVQLWMVPRNPIVLTVPGLAPHTKTLPAELAVVRRVFSAPSDQVPAEVAKTLQEVEKAGHKPLPDHRTTVLYLAYGDGNPRTVIAEVAVPIAPP